jgi:hypothetical protein
LKRRCGILSNSKQQLERSKQQRFFIALHRHFFNSIHPL